MIVRVRRLAANLPLPERASSGSAGVDLRAAVEGKVSLQPGQRKLIPTGLALELERGWEGQLRPRSGLAFHHGITLVNSPGTIDSDYRGEIRVLLINHGSEPFEIERGERIAQLVIAPVVDTEWLEVTELSDSQRGDGGFGSTGQD